MRSESLRHSDVISVSYLHIIFLFFSNCIKLFLRKRFYYVDDSTREEKQIINLSQTCFTLRLSVIECRLLVLQTSFKRLAFPDPTLYFLGTIHIQIPMVSGSRVCPSGNTSPCSKALLRMYDLPFRQGPAMDTTHTGPLICRSLSNAWLMTPSTSRSSSSLCEYSPVCGSQLQLFGRQSGTAWSSIIRHG